ncbi:succinate-semialdehyde dehydrogenase [NADP+] GabD, partial [Vibrio parahaemolyticus 861]
EPFLRTQQSV